jgi:hypothetical protein
MMAFSKRVRRSLHERKKERRRDPNFAQSFIFSHLQSKETDLIWLDHPYDANGERLQMVQVQAQKIELSLAVALRKQIVKLFNTHTKLFLTFAHRQSAV